MDEPRLLITGTGRCGTYTWALQLGGEHEKHERILTPLTPRFHAGMFTAEQASQALRGDWHLVEADWKFGPLLPALDALSEPLWLWVVRRPEDTVASMVGRGWYAPGDDDLLPVSLYTVEAVGEPSWRFWPQHEAHRITAPLVGEASLREWRGWPQHVRCAWWWDWYARWMMPRLPGGRHAIARVEDEADPRVIAEWAGVESVGRFWGNASEHADLTHDEAADVLAVCAETRRLFYP